jgi:sporulation protein YlmC with PRC-barrel domain
MLQLSASLLNKPVLSLRTGRPVAAAVAPIINPNNLKIEGFYCQDSMNKQQLVLLYQDIRETIQDGFIINDHDVLAEPDELIRLKDILELQFELLGKQVETISKEKIGKVSDYAVETETMYVQKIYVARSILKSFTGGSLSIDRSQINEITNKRIIINDLLRDSAITAPVGAA